MQSIYAASMLEELKLFQVADRRVELFQSGALPIARGVAGQQLGPTVGPRRRPPE